MAATASLWLLDLCTEYGVASYLKGISSHLPGHNVPTPICHNDIPAGFQAELRVVAQRIIEATTHQSTPAPLQFYRLLRDTFAFPVALKWNARSHGACVSNNQRGDSPEFEARLQEQFPPCHELPPMNSPFSIVDDAEEVVFIYLPDMLLPERQGYNDTLYISRNLGAAAGRADNAAQISAQTWLAANIETGLLLSTALAIAHPAQYRETRQALGYLASLPEFNRHMQQWTFAFNAVTLICNRLTPLHRDRASGGAGFYDLLLSIGGGPRTILSLPGLGIRVQYDSGTVAMFSGHQHTHEVWGFEEERACIACYARPPVIRWLGGQNPARPTGPSTLPEGWWQALIGIPEVRRAGV
ncbi:unnamed protein product [Peniophora sp. CBMAI 1063]|nr:unnamed protein product [Peniophora sp. CBMAI 1063]